MDFFTPVAHSCDAPFFYSTTYWTNLQGICCPIFVQIAPSSRGARNNCCPMPLCPREQKSDIEKSATNKKERRGAPLLNMFLKIF